MSRILPLILILLLGATASAQAVRPNIILLLSDDQGWTGTSVPMDPARPDARSDFHQTPNLARLAAAGMTFSRGYSPAQVCAPSRQSIQLGITPAQLHLTKNPEMAKRTPFESPAIPEVLSSIDPAYASAHFGKWHQRMSPKKLGYEVSDGRTGNDEGGNHATGFVVSDDPKEMFSITERAIRFMEDQVARGRPFYLQVSHFAVHLRMETTPESYQRYETLPRGNRHRDPNYAAMTEDLDTAVGRLLDRVEALGIADRTYIVYMSDNGARLFTRVQNAPLRKGKFTLYEGGIRVPFVVTGPGIAPGSTSAVPVVGWDLLPTFADLAGDPNAVPSRVEGGSIRAVLEAGGEGAVIRPRRGLVFHESHKASALVDGDWKLVVDGEMDALELYNLATDLGETKNLAQADPARAAAMRDQLLAHLDAVGAERLGTTARWGRCAAGQLAAAASLCRAELRCAASDVEVPAADQRCTSQARAAFASSTSQTRARASQKKRTCRAAIDPAAIQQTAEAITAQVTAGLDASNAHDRALRASILRASGKLCRSRIRAAREPLTRPRRGPATKAIHRAERGFEKACGRATDRAARRGVAADDRVHAIPEHIERLAVELVLEVSSKSP